MRIRFCTKSSSSVYFMLTSSDGEHHTKPLATRNSTSQGGRADDTIRGHGTGIAFPTTELRYILPLEGDHMARLSTIPDDPRTDEPPILDAATQWKRECLLSDGSIFSNSSLWSIPNLAILDEHFSKNPIVGDEA